MSMNRSAFGPNKTLRAMNFICNAPQAQSVSLVGDFNEWNPAAHRMKQMPDGAWLTTVELKHGHHRYAFLIDGALTLDPRAQGITRNDQGERVSLIPVS
jgi:1,4-alpha-glucan branching enzyme